MIFSKKQNFAFGLDFSDLDLRAAQSQLSGDKIKLQALSKITLEKGIIQNEEIRDPETVVKKINTLLAKPIYGTFNTNEVVAKLPRSMSYIKYISLENSPNNLSTMVANEVEKHIPLAKKDMFYDFQLIKKDKDHSHILIGAAPQNIVNQYVAILKASKLEISALEISSICDCRCLIKNEKIPTNENKVYGLINIGFYSSSLIIYANNSIVLSISMPISSQVVTEQIAKTLEIKIEQAEKAKIICGLDKAQANGIVFDILSKMIDALINKVQSTFEYFFTHYPEYNKIDEILLYGAGANIKNLENLIANKLNIPTRSVSPMQHFDENEEKIMNILNKNKKDPYSNPLLGYTSAIGLSLRNIFLKK
jgi:type IV pilus assembly protein PilM